MLNNRQYAQYNAMIDCGLTSAQAMCAIRSTYLGGIIIRNYIISSGKLHQFRRAFRQYL